jgi:hypothetical protein
MISRVKAELSDNTRNKCTHPRPQAEANKTKIIMGLKISI